MATNYSNSNLGVAMKVFYRCNQLALVVSGKDYDKHQISKFFIFIKVEISAWEFQVECLIQVLGPNKRQKLTLWSSVFKQKIFWIKNPDE